MAKCLWLSAALQTKSCAEEETCLRPGAEHATDDHRLACARLQERSPGGLKGDLNAILDLQHFVGGKQQPRFADVDGFSQTPALFSLPAITQGQAEVVPGRPAYPLPALFRFVYQTGFRGLCFSVVWRHNNKLSPRSGWEAPGFGWLSFPGIR